MCGIERGKVDALQSAANISSYSLPRSDERGLSTGSGAI